MSATQTRPTQAAATPAHTVDAVIVGAGFAGMYMLHRLRALGLSVRVLEAATGVGGTWFWNRYPGARCDVEIMQYSYSFLNELQQEWKWSERFAAQPEILKYANHVADRLDLRRNIEFETRVTDAVYDEDNSVWQVRTDKGEAITARYCVMAVGCLSSARTPDFKGLETIEATQEAEDNWVEHVNEAAFKTLYPGANSWYMGANVPGKPRVFMPYIGGVGSYREKCTEIASHGYEGFLRTGHPTAAAAE